MTSGSRQPRRAARATPLPVRAHRRPGGALVLPLLLAAAAAISGRVPAARGQQQEIQLTGALRVRPEFRDNADFNQCAADRHRFFAQRTRLGADIRINPKVEARVVAQDSRVWGTETSTLSTGSAADSSQTLALLEGYVDLRWIWDLPLEVRLGRQPLGYGHQRLVSRLDWDNRSRVFDAYRIHFGLGAFFVDFLSAKLADTNGPGGSGHSDQDRHLSGVYFSKEGDRLELLDLYWLRVIDKTRPATGTMKLHTFGVLGSYALRRNLNLEIEFAGQTGEQSGEVEIGAQALAVELAWRGQDRRKSEAAVGFDWASGDADSLADGKVETFNQLFPDWHRYLGRMDYVGRQNVRDLWARAGAQLTRGIGARVEGHYLQLDEPADAWYGADGRVNPARPEFGATAGRDQRRLGTEIDVTLDCEYAGAVAIELGYGHFFPGELVGLGGRPDSDSDFLYSSFAIDW